MTATMSNRERRIITWMSRLAPSTRTQYEVYIRGLREAIGAKAISEASKADVLRYLRGLASYWMQRRGLSALRGCFEAMQLEKNPVQGLTIAAVRGSSPSSRARQALRREGWSEQKIAMITWGELAAIAFAGNSISRSARRDLTVLLAEAFPGRTIVKDLILRAHRHALGAE